jgi:hypothetical protein
MIIIGSALLFAFGLLVLLVQAIRIIFSLIKIVYYLLKAIMYLAVLVVCIVCLAVQYVLKCVDWWERKAQSTVDAEILPPARLTRRT